MAFFAEVVIYLHYVRTVHLLQEFDFFVQLFYFRLTFSVHRDDFQRDKLPSLSDPTLVHNSERTLSNLAYLFVLFHRLERN